jgi:hypothetical protein
MAIATFDDLRVFSPYLSDDGVRIAKSRASKNLFLSHSLSDVAPARHAVAVLQEHGASVYIDIEDGGMKAASSSSDIATRLRGAIETCKRLVVIVTENTHTSRWIPWEVGLSDAFNGTGRVALLPLKQSASARELWVNQEYFDLYARIERSVSSDYKPYWSIRMPNGQYWTLRAWLDHTKPR